MDNFQPLLEKYASDLTEKFSLPVSFNPEDQLKRPVSRIAGYSVSGFEVVKSWLGYWMRNRSEKSSSPLDDIRPESWEFDDELLDLLWVLDHTIDLLPNLAKNLELILASDLFAFADLPQPTDAERKRSKGVASGTPLFDFAGLDISDDDE